MTPPANNKHRERRRPEKVSQHEADNALAKIKAYKEEGLNKEIVGALKAQNISISTLNAWLLHPSRIVTATKAPSLIRAARELPPLTERKKYQAYQLLLNELGLSPGHAEELKTLTGAYLIRHSMLHQEFQIGELLRIHARRSPESVYFFMRYQSHARDHVCDGLVARRNGIVHLVGISEKNMFLANFKSVRDPKTEVMYGSFSMEETYAAEVCYGRMALISTKHSVEASEAKYIEEYLKRPLHGC